LIPKEGSNWSVPEFARDIDEDSETVKSSLDWLDTDQANKLTAQFKDVISELQEESRAAVSELIAAENEKERAKKWVRKCRSELIKVVSRKRGLERILGELETPSKAEANHE
jgi:ribonuclease D